MIRLLPVPRDDRAFAQTLLRALGTAGRATGDRLEAESALALRRALGLVRRSFPEVWIRAQDPLGSMDPTPGWYVYREIAPLTAARPRRGLR
jgi:hypothetical protein